MINTLKSMALLALALLAAGCAGAGRSPLEMRGATTTIRVLSSDPARVTGGDALIEVTNMSGRDAPTMFVNGSQRPVDFKQTQPGTYVGVVTGLAPGGNLLTTGRGGRVQLTNYALTGPVFAGPKERPFLCETTKFKLADGSTLPAPLDADCSIEPVVTYVYRSEAGGAFKPLPSRVTLPADVATTSTTLGKQVPFVVRVEAGTIDRGIYQIAMLHDPTKEQDPSVLTSPQAWNRRLVYVFGGGCNGMYRQGARTENVLSEQFIGGGYAVVSNSLNVFANNCDDLLAAEALMMTRERAIERLGVPLFTLGWGCSGGAHQVLLIADNYPGLLDGIMPLCNSVDFFRLGQHTTDIRLLYDWFATSAAAGLTELQKLAITGTRLNADAGGARLYDATNCPDAVPASQAFNSANPRGVRCGQEDHIVNSLGREPATALARNTLDNVGVQYGLGALQDGTISVKQFLDLNEQVGGYDRNGARSPHRSVGDAVGIAAAYRSGRVLNGGLGLKTTPILEQRNYSDFDDAQTPGNRGMGATHLKYGTYALTARLERENGARANHVMLLESHRNGLYSASTTGDDMSRHAIRKMDEWLTALAADTTSDPRASKVLRAKPRDLVDACYDLQGRRIVEPQTVSGGRCNELYPTYVPPRVVAGGPMTNDVLKCQLKPVLARDYRVTFSDSEFARLRTIFPQGVCDWALPGVGQQPPAGPWLSY